MWASLGWGRIAAGLLALVLSLAAPHAAIAQPTSTLGILLRDEGVPLGKIITLDCAGAGVTCTKNGSIGTLTVSGGGGGAPTTASYWTATTEAGLSNETDLGALTTGLLLNTVTGGVAVPSAYGGTSCTPPQFMQTLTASGAATCATPAGSGNVNAGGTLTLNELVLGQGTTNVATLGSLGTTTTVLHGNAAGAPSFAAVVSADLNITTTSCTNQAVTAISAGAVGTCSTVSNAMLANSSLTVSGTADQISVAGGGPVALGGTVTLSLPAAVTMPGSLTVTTRTGTPAAAVTFDSGGKLVEASALGFGQGGTGLSAAADDTVLVSTGAAWQAKTVPDCTDTGGNHLNYAQASNAFSCGTSGGGGAPTTASYWTATAEAGLSNETNLGALTTGLLLNTVTAGTAVPSAYAGTSCTSPQFVQSVDASGAATCATPAGSGTVTGTGTTLTLPKWTNGAGGVLGDSGLSEAATGAVTQTQVLGTELVTNGNFATGTCDGWTTTGWTCNAGTDVQHNAGNATALVPTTPLTLTAGVIYRLVFTISSRTVGNLLPLLGGEPGVLVNTNATFTQYFTAHHTTNLTFLPDTAFDGHIDDVSVKAVTQTILPSEGPFILDSASSDDFIIRQGPAQEFYLVHLSTAHNAVDIHGDVAIGDHVGFVGRVTKNTFVGSGTAKAIVPGCTDPLTCGPSENAGFGDNTLWFLDPSGNPTVNAKANAAFGSGALQDISTGYNNTGLGHHAAWTINTGHDNTVVGSDAFAQGPVVFFPSASYNTFVGSQAWNTLQHYGTGNSGLGALIEMSGTAPFDYTLGLGYAATVTASHQAVFGSITGYITEMYMGAGVVGNNAFPFTLASSGAQASSNAQAPRFTLAGGKSRGNAVPGIIAIATSTPVGSGSTIQAWADRWTFTGNDILAATDGGGNIGAISATRPDLISAKTSLYVGGNQVAGAVAGKLNAALLAIASQAIGDLLYADSTTTFARLADVAAGSYLLSGGVGAAPVWSTLKLPNAATTGDILTATASNSIGVIAATTAGLVLTANGAGVASTYQDSAASTQVFTNKTFNAESTGNVLAYPVSAWLPAAGCNNATAGTVWDLPATTPAAAACVTGTNIQKGVLDFADSGPFVAQNTFFLDGTWTTTGGVDATILWTSTATTGDAIWNLQIVCTAVGGTATDDPAFPTAGNNGHNPVTTTVSGTTNAVNSSIITGATLPTSCVTATPMLMHFRLSRDGTATGDTLGATARFIGMRLNYRRSI